MTRVDLLRHGFAAPSHPAGDAARALTADGAAAIRALGAALGGAGWRPDRAFSSPLVRARQTAAIVLGAAGSPLVAGILEELEPETDPADASAAIAAQLDGARHVLIVAHLPLLGRLIGHWAGHLASFSPGELVRIEFEDSPGSRTGRIVTPNVPH